ncbi:universal stress protein [Micromonospora fluostatini]|uniref:universal stress protein n=1 Tax=Micromonospora sp. JCM 30529 TaxID=3421643 RepID=UPI003D181E6F
MNTADGAAVVVGVDGSPEALDAVRLAARQAHRHHRPLRVVHGFIWPKLRVATGPPPDAPPGGGLRPAAEHLVAEAVATAEATVPGLRVTGEIIDGEAAAVLLGEAPAATMIVVGDRGLGGFTALLVGSVAVQVAAHAPCPVLVTRGTPHPDGPVVVGVDDSPRTRDAVAFAAHEATTRDTHLVALHAYRHPASTGPGDMQPLVHDEADLRTEEDLVAAEALAGLADHWPDLTVTRRTVRGRARTALVDASREAQLVVVGGHRRSVLGGLLLGSVSQALLHHSACPVAVTHTPD